MADTRIASYLETLEPIASGVIAENAVDVDQNGTYPREAVGAISSLSCWRRGGGFAGRK